MNKTIKLICLILLLTLNFSCIEKPSTENETNNPELVATSTTDTLKFTSGISAIFQDSRGSYWFGSQREGIAVYDGKTFIYFSSNDGLTDNQIHSVQEDKDGVIWINTQMGVSSYDGTRITDRTGANTKTLQNNFQVQPKEPSQGEWMRSDNDLWFEAGVKEGVYRFDGQNLNYLAFPHHKTLNPNDNLFAVTDISNGKNDMIWFATYAGVFGYNGSDFTIIDDETLGIDRKIAPLHVRSILEDSKGRLWIGNNGIGVLLKEGDAIFNFSEKNNLIHPNSTRRGDKSPQGTLEHVFAIAEDENGNIWFGDRDAGVWKYDGTTMKNFTRSHGLTSDYARSIYRDKNGELWFGMADGSIYKLKGEKFEKQF